MKKHWSMRTRLLLMYLLFAILPTAVLFSVYLNSLTGRLKDEVSQTMMQTLKQASLNIENDLNTLSRTSDYLFGYDAVNVPLSADLTEQTVQAQVEEISPLRKALAASIDSSNISSIRLYVDDRKIYARERINFFPMSDFLSTPAFADVGVRGSYMQTSCSGVKSAAEDCKEYISFVRLLKDMRQVGRTVGALLVDLDKSRLDEVLNKMAFPQECLVYLVNAQGEVLTGNAKEASPHGPWAKEGFHPGEETVVTVDNQVYIIKGMKGPEWFLVAELPEQNISYTGMTDRTNLILYLVILMVFIGLVLVISTLIVNGVAIRVQQLASVFGSTESDYKILFQSGAQGNHHSFLSIFRSLDESLGSARSLIRPGYEQMDNSEAPNCSCSRPKLTRIFSTTPWTPFSGWCAPIKKKILCASFRR